MGSSPILYHGEVLNRINSQEQSGASGQWSLLDVGPASTPVPRWHQGPSLTWPQPALHKAGGPPLPRFCGHTQLSEAPSQRQPLCCPLRCKGGGGTGCPMVLGTDCTNATPPLQDIRVTVLWGHKCNLWMHELNMRDIPTKPSRPPPDCTH